jgi:Flp pilus assembly secretin CpaC
MKCRAFNMGLIASPFIAASGPALANDGVQFRAFARIRLKLENTSMQPKDMNFTYSGKTGYHLNLQRNFPQSNEDRAYIPGLKNPTLSYLFKGSRQVGNVRLSDRTIYITPKINVMGDYAGIHLANTDRSFLLGDSLVGSGSKPSGEKIPGLSTLPVIGQLFRSSMRTDNKRHLMILITPSIVKF